MGRLITNDATTQLTTTGSVLDGREVTTDHLPDGLSNITTRTLEIVAGTGSSNTATDLTSGRTVAIQLSSCGEPIGVGTVVGVMAPPAEVGVGGVV